MAFRFDKFTIKAQEAVQRAQVLAVDAGNPQIDALHLLAALLAETDGIVRPVLDKIGANLTQLDTVVASELGHLPKVTGGSPPQMGPALAAVLERAQADAAQIKDEFVSTEHLLLAATQVDSKAKDALNLNAIGEEEILTALQAVRGSGRVADQNPEEKFQALQKYGIDLVQQAN